MLRNNDVGISRIPVKRVFPALLVIFLLAAEVIRAPAAPTRVRQIPYSNLSGTVSDETNAAVAEAELSLMNVDTGFQRSVTSDDRGFFIVPLLAPGRYALSARMPGFATVTINDITVHASIDVSLVIVLKPRGVAESIDVVAYPGVSGSRSPVVLLDTSNAATKYSVTNREVMNLPVFANELGRNTLESLPFLVPGVTPNTTLGTLSQLRASGIAVKGSRSSSVSFNIEGGDDNDAEYNRALAALPNPDALEEFTFITSNYQADLGRSAGGVVNAVVKSGTAHLRGNVRYLGINDALNARGFFDPRTPRFRLNNFGGQLGGPATLPLLHGLGERLSFFADYEGTRSRRETTSTFSVPSAAERKGDFSALPRVQQPFDPLEFNHTGGTQFAGGKIPANRLDPIAQTYLSLFVPMPNSGDYSFVQLLPSNFANDQGALRLDYRVSNKDNLNLILLSTSSRVRTPSGRLPVQSQDVDDVSSYDFIARHTRTLTPSSINQITASIVRYSLSFQLFAPGGTGRDPGELGFVGIHPQTPTALAAPSVVFADGTSSILSGYGDAATKTAFLVKDDFSRAVGRHSLKFGAEGLWYWGQRTELPASIDGEFEFAGSFRQPSTRNTLADFLLGLPYVYLQSTDSASHPRQSSYQLYGMDDLRVSKDFTVTLGLRYELTLPATDSRDELSAFRPGRQSSVFPQAPAGLIFVGDTDPVLGRLPRGLYSIDYRDFAPRIGIAFVPRHLPGPLAYVAGDGKMAIRTGWGIFYDHSALYNSTRISTVTQPFSFTGIFFPSTFGASFKAPFGAGPDPFPVDLSKGQFSSFPFLYSVDPSFATPYTYNYDFVIERELGPTTTLELAYVGSNSFRTVRDRQLNPAPADPTSTIGPFNVQGRRLYPLLGSIISAESSGRARSDTFQAQIRRRFSRGLMFEASYVLARSTDNGGTLLSGTNTDLLEWARSPFDRRHSLVISYSYDLSEIRIPHLGRLLSDWRISGITEFRSGLPLDIFQSSDPTLTDSDPTGFGIPDLVGPFKRTDPRSAHTLPVNGFAQTGNFFFDPSAFKTVSPSNLAQARNGDAPRMAFDGPGFNMWSVSVARSCKLPRDQRVVLRADIRNLFNHANFDTPNVQADSLAFGQVTSAAPGRTVQFSIRYTF